MNKRRGFANERLEDELDELEEQIIKVPARLCVGWRRSEGLRKMPRAFDFGDDGRNRHHLSWHHVRRHAR